MEQNDTSTASHVREVHISPLALPGELALPDPARGIVLFAHGSGSSRLSPRNRYVASALHGAGLATLLFDLLSEAEAARRSNVFDISLLADRLRDATGMVQALDETRDLPVGYFGASTGAAAALVAAALSGRGIRAVVSRGGRPDLAAGHLGEVTAPTLLIVGGLDSQVLALNAEALEKMRCERELRVVEGATHLFEEPGTLDTVVDLARQWFTRHLPASS